MSELIRLSSFIKQILLTLHLLPSLKNMKAFVFIMQTFAWQAMSFSPCLPHQKLHLPHSTKMHNAMERLHDPSTNAFGPVEHIYSLADIDTITHKIEDDEWTALGSSIAESLLETVLDVCSFALRRMSWVDRMDITNQVAVDVSKTVEVSSSSISYMCICNEGDLIVIVSNTQYCTEITSNYSVSTSYF